MGKLYNNQKYNISLSEEYKILKPYIQDKDVLDIGCIDHSLVSASQKGFWIHDFIKHYSQNVTGIDIIEEEVKK